MTKSKFPVAFAKACMAFAVMCSMVGCGNSADSEEAEKPQRRRKLIQEAKPSLSDKAAVKERMKNMTAEQRREFKKRLREWKKMPKAKRQKLIRQEMRRRYVKRLEAEANGVVESLPPKEREMVKSMKDALSEEDFKKVAGLAARARGSANPTVRSEAVEALKWFGEQSLSELTPFLADSDEDVAREAEMAWERALSEVEDNEMKLGLVEEAMKSLDKKEMLDSIAMNYHSMEDKAKAVSSLIRVIDDGSAAGAEAARETYEFLTGQEWTNKNDAWKWVGEVQQKAAAEAAEEKIPADGDEVP